MWCDPKVCTGKGLAGCNMSAQPLECEEELWSISDDEPLPELPEIDSGRVPPTPVVSAMRQGRAAQGGPGSRASRWAFTYNYNDEDEGMIRAMLEVVVVAGGPVQYMIVGREVAPTTGQLHFQGYLETTSTQRFGAIKKILGERVHVEVALGTREENEAYCKKEGRWTAWGTPKAGKGSRTDLLEIKAAMDGGMNLTGVSQAYFGQFLRYHKGFEKYRSLNVHPSGRGEMTIRWFWGPTGSGKTRAVRTIVDALGKDVYWLNPSPTGVWWNGYDGQEIVVMDELRAGWFPHNILLRIFDRSPYRAPFHGGSVALENSLFLITTNNSPNVLYKDDPSGALNRRVRDFGYVYELQYDCTYVKNTPKVLC